MENKKLGGVLVAAGIAIGAIGQAAISHEPEPVYVAHAWDVRRYVTQLPDGGVNVDYAVEAWFSKQLDDGGTKDVGPGKNCSLDQLILGQQGKQLVETCAPK